MKACKIPLCNYPEGECQNLCQTAEERRQDVIGQNGNTGEHYGSPSYADEVIARLIILKEIQMDIISDVSNGLLYSIQTNCNRMRRVIAEIEKITASKLDARHYQH